MRTGAAPKTDLRIVSPVHQALRTGVITQGRRLILSGNDAIVRGAIDVGARGYFGYPITPSTEIEEGAARYLLGMGGVFLQTEDEIAAIGAAIGASLAGLKVFTASSGPGISLKQELIGFAAITEVPLVIINVQRAGPSTGGPTDVGQSDVMQARWGTHGDHPIIVIAPNSPQECYEETIRAFNLSERYRMPVIILSDAKVGQMKEPAILPPLASIPIVNRRKPVGSPRDYEPFGLTEDGVPPLAGFGDGFRAHFTGLYHGRNGLPTKDPAMVDEQLRRIHAKLETAEAKADILKTEEFVTDDADVVVVAFGITSRAAKDAVILARQAGIRAGLLRPITLWPSDEVTILRVLGRAKKVIVPELNLGQYGLEIDRLAGHLSPKPQVVGINKVDTALISPADILREIKI